MEGRAQDRPTDGRLIRVDLAELPAIPQLADEDKPHEHGPCYPRKPGSRPFNLRDLFRASAAAYFLGRGTC